MTLPRKPKRPIASYSSHPSHPLPNTAGDLAPSKWHRGWRMADGGRGDMACRRTDPAICLSAQQHAGHYAVSQWISDRSERGPGRRAPLDQATIFAAVAIDAHEASVMFTKDTPERGRATGPMSCQSTSSCASTAYPGKITPPRHPSLARIRRYHIGLVQ